MILQNTSPNPNGVLLFFSAFASVGLAATALWWTTQPLLAAQRHRGIRGALQLSSRKPCRGSRRPHIGSPAARTRAMLSAVV